MRWGWAVVRFDYIDSDHVRVHAFGYKRVPDDGKMVEAPIEPGELLAISMPDGTALYEVLTISYCSNPDDLYEAEVKYVQHLTGIRIMAHASDPVKRARSMAWGKSIWASRSNGEPEA